MLVAVLVLEVLEAREVLEVVEMAVLHYQHREHQVLLTQVAAVVVALVTHLLLAQAVQA
jgi:hypothetical protein